MIRKLRCMTLPDFDAQMIACVSLWEWVTSMPKAWEWGYGDLPEKFHQGNLTLEWTLGQKYAHIWMQIYAILEDFSKIDREALVVGSEQNTAYRPDFEEQSDTLVGLLRSAWEWLTGCARQEIWDRSRLGDFILHVSERVQEIFNVQITFESSS